MEWQRLAEAGIMFWTAPSDQLPFMDITHLVRKRLEMTENEDSRVRSCVVSVSKHLR